MGTPIDAILDGLEYKDVPPYIGGKNDDGLPYVIREGLLKLGEAEMRVYVLSNGSRVIDKEDVDKWLRP